MTEILTDTSALVALADADDQKHGVVSTWFVNHAQDTRLVLTDYVFDECMTLMKSRFGAQAAISFGRRIRSSQFCRFVHITPQDEEATWQVFGQYADKGWSYTDCSSLVVMRRLAIEKAFATDHHFRQMGVTVVP
jgi:predicted nucleic acid-binding protein